MYVNFFLSYKEYSLEQTTSKNLADMLMKKYFPN